MNFLDKLERKFGKFAIPNLMTYVVLGNAIIFLLVSLGIGRWDDFVFYWPYVLNGQWWRIFSFIFIPESMSLIWIIFTVMLYYYVGSALERAWGTFKFNLYYFTGVLGTLIVAIIFGIPATATYINLSLFLGFATLFPDLQFMIYFIIPIKAKYMAIFYFVILGIDVINGGLPVLILVAFSLLNYFLFFGVSAIKNKRLRQKGYAGQRQFKQAQRKDIQKGTKEPIKVAFHKCSVCGRTELDDPELEFRYCSSCNGHHEYCMDHLRDHEHIQ